ncbi:uncharacterized protein LOC118410003 isoform X1 [Branchiostoma floridae]|uniref:Uncharacterized protein LOC118410003 isoform X1 n=1 Tax=Branchiostoma floridae TaxID=7739 RepID=A0A9J7MGW4_BRAFL|nr:uncharacterized protein LOC118410003 isoform X1 [Branchiostoma floridae]
MALDAGAEFSDWAEFLAALAAFQEANHVELSIVTSKTVLNENRKLPDSVDKFPEEHVYRAAKFGCIHHGKPRSRSTGIRGNQSSFRMGCPAEIYVSSDRKKGKLVIKTFNNNHNHEVNEDVRKFYPSQRRLDGDLLEEARKLTRLKVDVKRLKDHIHSSSGKLTTLKDLHNLRTSLDPKETEGEAVLRALQDFLNSDKGAKVAVVQKPDKTLDALYIQTSAMASSFQKFPEVIFMDSTYKTNNLNMPLFTITVMDGDGVGQPVGYVILTDETKSSIVTALQLFLQHNPQSAAVRTVIIDKDPSEIAAVSEVLPHADVIICLFHTMKALKEAARQHVKDREVHEEVTKLIKKLAYSLTEESYDEAFGELVSLEGAEGFAGYYTRQWHNIRTQWVKCFTDRYTNYGNRTNNRVESSHDKLKKLLRGKVTLSKLVRNLVLFSSTKASQSSVRGFNEQMKVPTGRTCPIENAYMMEYTTYAGKVICQQLSLARLGKYKVKREEDGSFSVGIHERSYKVNNTCTQCSCHFLQKMGMPCRHLFAARIEAAFELFDMSLVAERWKKDTKAHAENAELETQSQNIITCETIPSKRAKSAASKYTETMQVCKEIANVNSLCGQKAYDNRIKQLRYMLECYKSNKTVTCICAEDDNIGISEDEESQEDEDRPVEAGNLRPVTSHQDDTDVTDSEDEESHEDEDSPVEADNLRPVTSHQDDTDVTDSEDEESHEDEDSPVEADNLHQVSTTTNEDNNNSEDKGSQEGEGSPMAADNPRQVSTSTNEDNSNSEDKGSQEGEGSPIAAGNLRQVSTSTNEDNSNSEDKGSQEGEGSPIAAGNPRQVSTTTNEDNNNSEDKGSQEGEGSPMAADNPRQVSTSTNEDNSNSEDKGSQEGEGSPIAAGNLRQVSTSTNEDNSNSEDKGSQEGEGSPIAAGNLRQVSTSTNEDNSNSEDKGSQEGEGSPIAAGNLRQVSTTTNEDNNNSEDKGSQEGEGSPIAADNLRQVSTSTNEDNSNSEDKGSQEGEGSPIAADNPRQVSTSTNEDNSNSEDKGSQEGERSPIMGMDIRYLTLRIRWPWSDTDSKDGTDSEDEESHEDEDSPVEADNLRPVTSHQDDTDVTDSEDEESHEDEDSPEEADNLRPVTSHQDDTDVTDSEDEESHEDEDSPVEADNLRPVTSHQDDTDVTDSEDEESHEDEDSPVEADNLRPVTSHQDDTDVTDSEDEESHEDEDSPVEADNLRPVTSHQDDTDVTDSEDEESHEDEDSPVEADNLRPVTSHQDDTDVTDSEDEGSQEGEGSPIAAGNLRQVSTTPDEDNTNSHVGQDKKTQFAACTVSFRHLPPLLKLPPKVQVRGRPKDCKKSVNKRFKVEKPSTRKQQRGKKRYTEENTDHSESEEPLRKKPKDDTVKQALAEAMNLMKDMPKGKLVVGNVSLNTSDMKRLLPGQWLHDKLVTAFLDLLGKLYPGQVLSLPPQLAQVWDSHKPRYSAWLYEKICFASYKFVLLPVCHHDHWMLLVANVADRTVAIVNSSRSFDKYMSQFQLKWQHYMTRRSRDVEPQLSSWTNTTLPSSRQHDGNSCGVFVLMNAESIARGRELKCMGHKDVPSFQKHVIYQLLANSEQDGNCAMLENCTFPLATSWILCGHCHQWLHLECAGFSKKPRGTYVCDACSERIAACQCVSHARV